MVIKNVKNVKILLIILIPILLSCNENIDTSFKNEKSITKSQYIDIIATNLRSHHKENRYRIKECKKNIPVIKQINRKINSSSDNYYHVESDEEKEALRYIGIQIDEFGYVNINADQY